MRESELIGRRRIGAAAVLALGGLLAAALVPASAVALRGAPARIVFPIVGKASFRDDFGAPRWQGRHEGNDLLAPRKTPVVAVEAGTVRRWTRSPSAGCMLYLYGASGATYLYIHLNNDLGPGNDNRGSCRPGVAYAPGLRDGQRVAAGQLLGFVGDSGDANGGPTHLHFELHPGGGAAVSPYRWLRRAVRPLFPLEPAAAGRGASSAATLTLTGTLLRLTPPATDGTGGSDGIAAGSVPAPPPRPQRRDAVAAGSLLTLRVSLVAVSTGGRYRVERAVTLTVAPDAALAGPGGSPRPASALAEGARIRVTTAPLRLNGTAQRARRGALTAAAIALLR